MFNHKELKNKQEVIKNSEEAEDDNLEIVKTKVKNEGKIKSKEAINNINEAADVALESFSDNPILQKDINELVSDASGEISNLTEDFENKIVDKPEDSKKTTMPESDNSHSGFNPEQQLEKIMHLPREERIRELESWKKQYNEQRVALASMQVEMENFVKNNKATNKEELLSILDKYSSKYSFTPDQNELAKTAIGIFLEEHQAVHALREEYLNDKELFTKLFSNKPSGKITIEERPISLLVKCSNIIDYSKVHEVNKDTIEKVKFILKSIFGLYGSRGVTVRMPIPEIKGVVIGENLSQKSKIDIVAHEEQHAMYGLIARAYSRMNTAEELNNQGNKKEEVEEGLLEDSQENIFLNIENEILAMYAGKESLSKAVTLIMFTNYLDTYINIEIRNLLKGLTDAQDDTDDEKVKQTQEQEVNEVIEYLKSVEFRDKIFNRLLKNTNAIETMEDKGYSRQESIALFSHESFNDWPKFAERIVPKK